MQATYLIIFVVGTAFLGVLVALFFLMRSSRSAKTIEMRNLMGGEGNQGSRQEQREDWDIEEIKKRSGRAEARETREDFASKLFRAGFYTGAEKKKFQLLRMVSMLVSPVAVGWLLFVINGQLFLGVLGFIMGILIGFVLPGAYLDRQIVRRQEEIMYYLPLVIEQISIGVSSSLDIGPCIAQILAMTQERDSHNPITEMFVHVEKLIRSGLNLEDALVEVGDATGMTEVKHAFMFLAQCAKHGGEISRQLQELADAVTVQRQVQVEGRIAALPVKATGPLTAVFAGFFALLFAGLAVKLMGAFGA